MKVLWAVTERELDLTGKRIVGLPRILAEAGHSVDMVVHSKKVLSRFKGTLGHPNLRVIVHKYIDVVLTMQQRDSFVIDFIKKFHSVEIGDTGFPFWEQVGFDDYLWNVSQQQYPLITKKYDVVFLPIPSRENPNPGPVDIFYNNIMYYTKRENVLCVGYNYELMDHVHPFFLTDKFFDYLIMRDE